MAAAPTRSPVRSLYQNGHVAGLVLVGAHLHVRGGDVVPAEHLGHARIDAARSMTSLLAWLACFRLAKWLPWTRFWRIHTIARVHGQVVAGGAGAEHDHAAALHDEARDREGRFARVLEDEVDVVALAGDVPDRLAELARFLQPGRIRRR
jgi:hypothetical protein